jgi:Nucleotidyltransferase domain
VPGVVAVVLGGSYARRTARPDSDLDLGLYYSENSPPDVEAIRRCAETISAPNTPPTVVGYYQWGPWVNGGAWIRTPLGSLCLRLTLNTFLVTKAVSKPSIAFRCVPVISPIGSDELLALPMRTQLDLKFATEQIQILWKETVHLTGNRYAPKFGLTSAGTRS